MVTSTVTSFYDKIKAKVARATHDAEKASRFAVPLSRDPAHSSPELVAGLQKTKDAYVKAKKIFSWITLVTQVPANLRMGP
ncbi:hypothetical protein OnM2_025112 [Erysiphe neolycopersici]|uniref:Uncharacterized protein n=1 Tax=Erysiphe neolycopersici TaxID=212602 RepID=A0A420I160_9PEZI|nr:hypothetical protein OnM2_025112 [Erysiphe neolycopersici]